MDKASKAGGKPPDCQSDTLGDLRNALCKDMLGVPKTGDLL
jgi:hypothetical protein